MDADIRILPDLMHEQGYRTGYFGKWYLGDPARDSWDVMPIYPGDGRGNKHYFEDGGDQVYQTEIITPDVIDFMEADAAKPFCSFAYSWQQQSRLESQRRFCINQRHRDSFIAALFTA